MKPCINLGPNQWVQMRMQSQINNEITQGDIRLSGATVGSQPFIDDEFATDFPGRFGKFWKRFYGELRGKRLQICRCGMFCETAVEKGPHAVGVNGASSGNDEDGTIGTVPGNQRRGHFSLYAVITFHV